MSKGVIWGTGMGGRLGFNALMDDKFVNRSFDGGHSVFFENNNSIVNNYWVPLLEQDTVLEPLNKTSLSRKRDSLYEYMARLSSKIKLIYYSVLFSVPIFLFLIFISSKLI